MRMSQFDSARLRVGSYNTTCKCMLEHTFRNSFAEPTLIELEILKPESGSLDRLLDRHIQ